MLPATANRKMIQHLLLVIFIITNVCATSDNRSVKVIETQNGKVQGSKLLTLVEQKEYYSFKGIPFAQPPIGSFRFKVLSKIFYFINLLL